MPCSRTGPGRGLRRPSRPDWEPACGASGSVAAAGALFGSGAAQTGGYRTDGRVAIETIGRGSRDRRPAPALRAVRPAAEPKQVWRGAWRPKTSPSGIRLARGFLCGSPSSWSVAGCAGTLAGPHRTGSCAPLRRKQRAFSAPPRKPPGIRRPPKSQAAAQHIGKAAGRPAGGKEEKDDLVHIHRPHGAEQTDPLGLLVFQMISPSQSEGARGSSMKHCWVRTGIAGIGGARTCAGPSVVC